MLPTVWKGQDVAMAAREIARSSFEVSFVGFKLFDVCQWVFDLCTFDAFILYCSSTLPPATVKQEDKEVITRALIGH